MKDETLNRAIELRKAIKDGKNNLTCINNWKYRIPSMLCLKTEDIGMEIKIKDPEVVLDLLCFLDEKYKDILFKRQEEFDSL